MGWLSRFHKKQLEASWEFSTNGILWRLIPSSDGYFVGEDRDVDAKTVSFFCLDRLTGAIHWQGLTFEEPWWMGIEDVHHGVILFHGYAAPDMPDHRMITAVGCASGRVLWSNRKLQFLLAHGDRVYGAEERRDGRSFFAMDLLDGTVVGEPGEEEIVRLRAEAERVTVGLPDPVADSEVPEPIRRVLNRIAIGEEPASADALSDAGDAFVVTCHARSGGTVETPLFRQDLLVVSKHDGRVLYRDVLVEGAASVVPETFFFIGGMFYYIRERKTLKGLNLLSGKGAHGKNQDQAR